jgi:hypothetical protein
MATVGASAAAAAAAPKPKRLSKADALAAGSTYLAPKAFIESNFRPTKTANFGSYGLLGGPYFVVRRTQVVRAALEGGYGRQNRWSADLVLNKSESDDLARYLMQRLEMVSTCFQMGRHRTREIRSFYKRVEASEKTALSFIVGGMGAFLAAERWLAAGGQSVKSFLHVGIYTKALSSAASAIAFKSAGTKVPDYLAEASSGEWHVFESKGGHLVGRWARLCEGLEQLEHVPKVGWAGGAVADAQTCVCVHTSVDPGKALRVMAVDPPADGSQAGLHEGEPEADLSLVRGVCRLLVVLETLEQFRALIDEDETDRLSQSNEELRVGKSSLFRGLVVGLPDTFLALEDKVRQALAAFFVIFEAAVDAEGVEAGQGALLPTVRREERKRLSMRTEVLFAHGNLDELVSGVLKEDGGGGFLLRCSQRLGIEAMAQQLEPKFDIELARGLATQFGASDFTMTSGGMYIWEVGTDRQAPAEG